MMDTIRDMNGILGANIPSLRNTMTYICAE